MLLSPDYESFAQAYEAGRPQVLVTRLVADLETPVSAMLKLSRNLIDSMDRFSLDRSNQNHNKVHRSESGSQRRLTVGWNSGEQVLDQRTAYFATGPHRIVQIRKNSARTLLIAGICSNRAVKHRHHKRLPSFWSSR